MELNKTKNHDSTVQLRKKKILTRLMELDNDNLPLLDKANQVDISGLANFFKKYAEDANEPEKALFRGYLNVLTETKIEEIKLISYPTICFMMELFESMMAFESLTQGETVAVIYNIYKLDAKGSFVRMSSEFLELVITESRKLLQSGKTLDLKVFFLFFSHKAKVQTVYEKFVSFSGVTDYLPALAGFFSRNKVYFANLVECLSTLAQKSTSFLIHIQVVRMLFNLAKDSELEPEVLSICSGTILGMEVDENKVLLSDILTRINVNIQKTDCTAKSYKMSLITVCNLLHQNHYLELQEELLKMPLKTMFTRIEPSDYKTLNKCLWLLGNTSKGFDFILKERIAEVVQKASTSYPPAFSAFIGRIVDNLFERHEEFLKTIDLQEAVERTFELFSTANVQDYSIFWQFLDTLINKLSSKTLLELDLERRFDNLELNERVSDIEQLQNSLKQALK